jgi:hypothetical protein
MLIKLSFLPSISLLSSFVNGITRQEKLKLIIAGLAFAILLSKTIHWMCSRFWSQRRVNQKHSQPQVPQQPKSHDRSFVGHDDRYAAYRLDGGTIYQPRLIGNDEFQLQAVSANHFRPLVRRDAAGEESTEIVNILQDLSMNSLATREGDIYLAADLADFSANDHAAIDVVLNEKILAIHILPCSTTKDKLAQKPQEWMALLEWKTIFEGITLQQMQAKMTQAKLLVRDGIFQIYFPNKA